MRAPKGAFCQRVSHVPMYSVVFNSKRNSDAFDIVSPGHPLLYITFYLRFIVCNVIGEKRALNFKVPPLVNLCFECLIY